MTSGGNTPPVDDLKTLHVQILEALKNKIQKVKESITEVIREQLRDELSNESRPQLGLNPNNEWIFVDLFISRGVNLSV